MHFGAVTRLGRETAIGSCDDIVAADKTRKPDQAFGNPVRMLHDITGMGDHAGNQDFAVREPNPFPKMIFMLVLVRSKLKSKPLLLITIKKNYKSV